jgi:pyridoxal biosynthesis lyase PdxS
MKINFKLIDTQKYFRKEKEKIHLPEKNSLNETLKMVWEKKAKKASKTEFKMIRSLGKSQAGDIIEAVSNNTGMLAAIKTFRKSELKLEFLID